MNGRGGRAEKVEQLGVSREEGAVRVGQRGKSCEGRAEREMRGELRQEEMGELTSEN